MSEDLGIVGFRATYPSINYIFRDGQPAVFIGGKFATSNPMQILELRHEIKSGHPHIVEMTAEEMKVQVLPGQDLMAGLKAKFFAEFLEDQKKQLSRLVNEPQVSVSAPVPLMPASSTSIAASAAGGSGVSLAAQLATLKLPPQNTEFNTELPPVPANVVAPAVPVDTGLEMMALLAGINKEEAKQSA